MKFLLIIVCSALLMAGCATATIGKPFPVNNVSQLRIGTSTVADAKNLLGEPYQIQTTGSGEQLYIWQYIRSDATSGLVSTNVQTNTQQAALVFDEDNRLLRVQQLINVPAPISATTKPATSQTSTAETPSKAQLLDKLSNTPGLSYEEYTRRYRDISEQ